MACCFSLGSPECLSGLASAVWEEGQADAGWVSDLLVLPPDVTHPRTRRLHLYPMACLALVPQLP